MAESYQIKSIDPDDTGEVTLAIKFSIPLDAHDEVQPVDLVFQEERDGEVIQTEYLSLNLIDLVRLGNIAASIRLQAGLEEEERSEKVRHAHRYIPGGVQKGQ